MHKRLFILLSMVVALMGLVAVVTAVKGLPFIQAKVCPLDGCSDTAAGSGGSYPQVNSRDTAIVSSKETGATSIETLTEATFNQTLATGLCGMLGKLAGCEADLYSEKGLIDPSDYGLLGTGVKGIALMYQGKPASTQAYVADLLKSANIATPAYAQGIGFFALNPILEVWKSFRNIAYFFFVVIFLLIGFMIMFRKKVGQTAVTAQQAIPRVIVALLTVTFSYAIAAFLVDMMYLVMYLILGLFGKPATPFLEGGPFQIGIALISGGFDSGYDVADSIIQSFFGDTDVGSFVGSVLGDAGGLLAGVVVAITILVAIFRVFFTLLKTYVDLIMNIAFAPITLMMGAIPGKSTFMSWVRNVAGNLVAFPTVLVVLIIFDQLTGGLSPGGPDIKGPNNGFTPPYLFGLGDADVIPFIAGLGLLMGMDKFIQMAKEWVGAKKGFMDQIGQAAAANMKKGISGDFELIPGVAATNIGKWGVPGVPMLQGGLGAKNIIRKGAIAATAPASGLYGAGEAVYQRHRLNRADVDIRSGIQSRVDRNARATGSFFKDSNVKKPDAGKKQGGGH